MVQSTSNDPRTRAGLSFVSTKQPEEHRAKRAIVAKWTFMLASFWENYPVRRSAKPTAAISAITTKAPTQNPALNTNFTASQAVNCRATAEVAARSRELDAF